VIKEQKNTYGKYEDLGPEAVFEIKVRVSRCL